MYRRRGRPARALGSVGLGHGAFMEPRGCNWWQSVANRQAREPAKTSKNRCRGLPPVAWTFHGKEGVDGSSPSEGSAKGPQRRLFLRLTCAFTTVRWVWSPLMEPSGHEWRRQSRVFALNARSGDVRSPLATINSRSRFSSSRLSPTSISASLPAPKWRSETWRNRAVTTEGRYRLENVVDEPPRSSTTSI